MEEVQAVEVKFDVVEEMKKAAELALEGAIEKAYPGIKLALEEKLKDVIPGEQFDGLAILISQNVLPIVKDLLMKQIEKISDKV